MKSASGKYQTIFYVETQNGELLPRFVYLSDSHGEWRVAPTVLMGHYSKGREIHYTQETILTDKMSAYLWRTFVGAIKRGQIEEMSRQLFSMQEEEDFDVPKVNSLSEIFAFSGKVLGSEQYFRFEKEAKFYNDGGALKFLQVEDLKPGGGLGGNDNVSQDFESLDGPLQSVRGFIPDFTLPPVAEFRTMNSMLSYDVYSLTVGDIQVRVYESKLDEKPILWYMCNDLLGRVWISKIVFRDGEVTSFGTPSLIIHSGPLTAKPIEYRKQVFSLKENIEKRELPRGLSEHYVDITPALDHLLPIRLYREALHLKRKG